MRFSFNLVDCKVFFFNLRNGLRSTSNFFFILFSARVSILSNKREWKCWKNRKIQYSSYQTHIISNTYYIMLEVKMKQPESTLCAHHAQKNFFFEMKTEHQTCF